MDNIGEGSGFRVHLGLVLHEQSEIWGWLQALILHATLHTHYVL